MQQANYVHVNYSICQIKQNNRSVNTSRYLLQAIPTDLLETQLNWKLFNKDTSTICGNLSAFSPDLKANKLDAENQVKGAADFILQNLGGLEY